MTSVAYSLGSKYNRSDQIIDDVSKRSTTKILQLEGTVDEDIIRTTWSAFGLYISRQMRMGRGVVVPKFGIFSFSVPEILLIGTTNQDDRDKQPRFPVFIVAKDFVKGKLIKSAIYSGGNVRPYSVYGINGTIQQTKANYTEVGHYANIDKDYAKLTVERVLRQMADKAKANETFEMDLPNVGTFMMRSGMAAVAFLDYLVRETKTITKRPVPERVQKGDMSLNENSLKKFNLIESLGNVYDDKDANFLYIDEKAKEYMQRNLNINVDDIAQRNRPATAASRSLAKFSSRSKPLNENWMETNPSQVLKRPITANPLGKSKSVNREKKSFKSSESENSLKALTYWIRSNNLSSEDAYIELCNKGLGSCTDKSRLTHENFYKALLNVGVSLTPLEANSLFDQLDVNQDGYIDFNDWEEMIHEDGNRLQYIKDVIFRNNLKVDDVLKRMNLAREQGSITCLEFKEALKKLDEDLDDKQALKLAKGILRNREFLEINELIDLLECFEEDGTIYNINWFKNMLVKIKKKLESLPDPLSLRKEFENYDRLNKGILDIANFKTCLRKVKLSLSVKEINRLVRYIEKDDPSTVDYYLFLHMLEEVSAPAKENFVFRNLSHFAEALRDHLKKYKLTPITFIKKILNQSSNPNATDESGLASTSRINPEALAFYIQQQVFVQSSMEELGSYVQQIDIDKDGFINETDLESFLKRYQYIDNIDYVENTTLSTRTKGFFAKSVKSFPNLYPTKSLSNEKADMVLRDIRQALYLKKYSFLEFFRILDINQDGFITIGEFCQAIDKFVKFSQPIKEGFFAYMDKQKIGMINYSTFLETLNKSLFIDTAKVSDDNFEWIYETIDRIRLWFTNEGLSVEDAFRSADKDFDGGINKKDLKLFLIEVIKMREEDLNSAKIDRLFKLMDQFKRGLVQLNDFKRILTEDMRKQLNMTILGGKTFHGKTSFDWIINAKQQIGLVLSRNFNSLKESYEGISGHSKKILYSQFEKWVEDSRALFGFDLTEKLLQHVFSDCDPHKKGYLTETDWLNSFGGYNWTNQMISELQESLQNNFKNLEAAFHFFCQNSFSNEITFEKFREGVNSLFPKRFTISDITIMWNKLKNGSSNLSYPQFILLFEKKASALLKMNRPKTAGMVLESNKSLYSKAIASSGKNVGNPEEETDLPFGVEVNSVDEIVEKVKKIMRASKKSLELLFKEMDQDSTGAISNVEFRNCIKKMKLGLTSREIDLLLNSCDENLDGKVDIQEFTKKFKTSELGKRILDRSKQRLLKIRDDIYYYMLSPKDAFLTFNEDRTGKLTFDQFHQMMLKLCQLSGEEMLPFSILKDLFEFIDIRKDGVIDMNEWLQSFIIDKEENNGNNNEDKKHKKKKLKQRPATSLPRFENASGFIQTSSGMRKIIVDNPDYVSPIQRQVSANNINTYNAETIQESSKWQTTKEYDMIIKIISRNRKYLLEVFNDSFKRLGNVSYDKVKEVLQDVLRFNGINLQEKYWPYLLKFAIKDGNIDYKFLLEVYKERVGRVDSHPRIGKNL